MNPAFSTVVSVTGSDQRQVLWALLPCFGLIYPIIERSYIFCNVVAYFGTLMFFHFLKLNFHQPVEFFAPLIYLAVFSRNVPQRVHPIPFVFFFWVLFNRLPLGSLNAILYCIARAHFEAMASRLRWRENATMHNLVVF